MLEKRAVRELKNNQNGLRFWKLFQLIVVFSDQLAQPYSWSPASSALSVLSTRAPAVGRDGGTGAVGCSVSVLIGMWGFSRRRRPRGSTMARQILAAEVGCLSQKPDCLPMVTKGIYLASQSTSAVHLLSALSPMFASSAWNFPEELSNNLIDSTAVNWRTPHYTRRGKP